MADRRTVTASARVSLAELADWQAKAGARPLTGPSVNRPRQHLSRCSAGTRRRLLIGTPPGRAAPTAR